MAYQIVTPTKLGQGVATTGATTLYTTPASTRTFVKNIDICNVTSGAVTFNVYLVPTAGTASTSNALFYGAALAANMTVSWTGVQILNAGDTIQILASAGTSVTVTASGAEAV